MILNALYKLSKMDNLGEKVEELRIAKALQQAINNELKNKGGVLEKGARVQDLDRHWCCPQLSLYGPLSIRSCPEVLPQRLTCESDVHPLERCLLC